MMLSKGYNFLFFLFLSNLYCQTIIKGVVILNSKEPKTGNIKPAQKLKMGKSAIIPLIFSNTSATFSPALWDWSCS